MTLMEKHSNVNRIFESSKFAAGHQELTLTRNGTIGNFYIFFIEFYQRILLNTWYDFKQFLNSLFKNSIDATITPCPMIKTQKNSQQDDSESRRSSGNSIRIKITNANEDESLDTMLKDNFLILNDAERENLNDFEVIQIQNKNVKINMFLTNFLKNRLKTPPQTSKKTWTVRTPKRSHSKSARSWCAVQPNKSTISPTRSRRTSQKRPSKYFAVKTLHSTSYSQQPTLETSSRVRMSKPRWLLPLVKR